MGLPNDLILVRHGESEGNVVKKRSKKGDDSDFTPEFRSRHSSEFRLTARGREQAAMAGKWIAQNIGAGFDRYYVSEYARAMETAALLRLPQARWFADFYLRERDWGMLESVTEAERKTKFQEVMDRRKANSFFWTPPSGESLAEVCLRVDRMLDTLHRECDGKKVVVVSHGEIMWAFRTRLERLSQEKFCELDRSKKPHDQIHNCQILHYSRVDPTTGEIASRLKWMRSICPTDLSLSSNEWQEVKYTPFSNEALLERANNIKPFLQ